MHNSGYTTGTPYSRLLITNCSTLLYTIILLLNLACWLSSCSEPFKPIDFISFYGHCKNFTAAIKDFRLKPGHTAVYNVLFDVLLALIYRFNKCYQTFYQLLIMFNVKNSFFVKNFFLSALEKKVL